MSYVLRPRSSRTPADRRRTASWGRHIGLLLLLCGLAAAQEPDKKPAFELKDGDRVVFLGDGFLDRERHHGYIETMLTRRFPGRHLTFRNLAWEGDSVDVQLRPLGFPSLEDLLAQTKPTVVFISYGMNESFAGEAGVAAFEKGYRSLLDRIAKTGPREVVMISPLHHLWSAVGPKDRNKSLQLYTEVIRQIASKRSYRFVKLFNPGAIWKFEDSDQFIIIEDNDFGIEIDPDYKERDPKVKESTPKVEEPAPKIEEPAPKVEEPLGPYQLHSDDGVHLTASGYSNVSPLICDALGVKGESFDSKVAAIAAYRLEAKLRVMIVEKSLHWLHRWRAHNGEYIWGRRAKAFEGNAGNEQFPGEFAEIDRRIAELEAKIFELGKPVPHTYELVPEK